MRILQENNGAPERVANGYLVVAILTTVPLRLLCGWDVEIAIKGGILLLLSLGAGATCSFFIPKNNSSRRRSFACLISVYNGLCVATSAQFGFRAARLGIDEAFVFAVLGSVCTMIGLAICVPIFDRFFCQRRAFKRYGYCSACGYDLRGITSDRCPECGHRPYALADETGKNESQ